jgi:hypothetical protein
MAATTQGWLPDEFPESDASECGGLKSMRMCDPDKLLTKAELQQVDEALLSNKIEFENPCRGSSDPVELQIAVALIGKVRIVR